MRLSLLCFLLGAAAACSKPAKTYSLHGGYGGSLGPVTAVVNGSEVSGGIAGFPLPAGQGPEAVQTLALRYQTPCGAFDVPYEITERGAGVITAQSGATALYRHLVLVDATQQVAHEVRVGAQKLGPADGAPNGDPSWSKVQLRFVFGTECAASHPVVLDGASVGALAGAAPDDFGDTAEARNKSAIFVTSRSACFRLRRLATETLDKRSGAALGSRQAFEQRLQGPGAFYLRALPDVLMQEPTNAAKPVGLYEIACDAPP